MVKTKTTKQGESMPTCKFCRVNEKSTALDGKKFDFYVCDTCECVMCHTCLKYTSSQTGKDYCKDCMSSMVSMMRSKQKRHV